MKQTFHDLHEFEQVLANGTELKAMKGSPMKIHLCKDVIVTPAKRLTSIPMPLAYFDQSEQDVRQQVETGIIELITWPTDWISPAMFLPKPNGCGVRMVTDFSALNKFVQRPVHPFPTPSEIASSIPSDSKIFVTLDAKKGYWQIPLDVEPRDLTTFITSFGRDRYCRAPMGLDPSGDEYCLCPDQALRGLKGVRKIVDDIIIFAPNAETMVQRVKAVLERCFAHGITLSKNEVQVGAEIKICWLH